MNILEEANEITNGQRSHDYGDAYTNHSRTAMLWQSYLIGKYDKFIELGAEDVCYLNVLQKVARDMENPKRDNIVDIAGYARNIEMIREVADCDELCEDICCG